MAPPPPLKWHFAIDKYTNPFIPKNPTHMLPRPLAHFLGYRHPDRPQRPVGNLVSVYWAFVGVFASILLIEAVNRQVPKFHLEDGGPIIVASFGAAAVLEFYSIDAPLAQPRNAVLGQVVSAVVGTVVAKIFGGPDTLLLSTSDDPGLGTHSLVYRWVAGALACAGATASMALTGTVHPPAGATALMAVVDDRIVRLGWWYVPIMLLGCSLMLAVALLVNNIQRRFPVYWWSPEPTGSAWRRRSRAAAAAASRKEEPTTKERDSSDHDDVESATTAADAAADQLPLGVVLISKGGLELPETLHLLPEERAVLEAIRKRL